MTTRNTRFRGAAISPVQTITDETVLTETWEVISETVATPLFIYVLANGTAILGAASSVYLSTDNCATWSDAIITSAGNRACVQLANGDVLLVSTTTGKVHKSSDNGATWDEGTDVATGLLGIIQLADGTVITNTATTLYTSTDNGATWDGGTVTSVTGMRPMIALSNGSILAAQANGVYKSEDNGATWSTINFDVGASCYGMTQLANGNVLVCGFASNKVYTSTDNGDTWDAGTLVADGASLRDVSETTDGGPVVIGQESRLVYAAEPAIVFPEGASGVVMQATSGTSYWSFYPMTGSARGFKVSSSPETIWVQPFQTTKLYFYSGGELTYQFVAPNRF